MGFVEYKFYFGGGGGVGQRGNYKLLGGTEVGIFIVLVAQRGRGGLLFWGTHGVSLLPGKHRGHYYCQGGTKGGIITY